MKRVFRNLNFILQAKALSSVSIRSLLEDNSSNDMKDGLKEK